MELLEWGASRLKDAGTAQALLNTPEYWKEQFESSALDLLRQYGSFTSEEVVQRVGQSPSHPSAVGAITLALAKKHKLKVVYEKSKTPRSHGAIIGRWFR